MRYSLILSSLLMASCHDDRPHAIERTDGDSFLGTWKIDCFTTEAIDHWHETTYMFSEGTFQQGMQVHEDSRCNDDGEPSVSEGIYTFDKTVVTTAGVVSPVFYTTWFYQRSNEISFKSHLGLLVEGDVLYLVHPRDDGSYDVGFDLPFHKVSPAPAAP